MATHANTCPWGSEPQALLTLLVICRAYVPPAAKGYAMPQSSVQTILYGGESGKPFTPPKGGKKAVHSASQRPSPFAQWAVDSEEIYPSDYHARAQQGKRALQDASMNKVGAQGFDSSIYRDNLASNFSNLQTSRARAHGGANFLSHYGQEAPSAAPHASGEKVGYKTAVTAPVPDSYAPDPHREEYDEDYENYRE